MASSKVMPLASAARISARWKPKLRRSVASFSASQIYCEGGRISACGGVIALPEGPGVAPVGFSPSNNLGPYWAPGSSPMNASPA